MDDAPRDARPGSHPQGRSAPSRASGVASGTRCRLWLGRTLLAAVSLCAALLAAELLARRLRPIERPDPPMYVFDPLLGWQETPGAEIEVTDPEGRPIPVRINRHGFRGPERSLEKRAQATRIVILGDSFTEALGVREEESFSFRLEALLRDEIGPQAEVFGLGVSSYGTVHELLRLRRDIGTLDPDLVVFQVCVNDFWDNSKALSYQRRGPWAEDVPDDPAAVEILPVSRESEPLLPAPSPAWHRPLRWLKWNTAIGQALAAAVRPPVERTPEPTDDRAARSPGGVVDPLADPRFVPARRLTAKLLLQARDTAREHDAEFLAYVNPSTLAFSEPAVYEASGRTERYRLDRDVEAWLVGGLLDDCRELGVRCVWNRSLFVESVDAGRKVTGRNDPHWNALGHSMVADDLLREVLSVLHSGDRTVERQTPK